MTLVRIALALAVAVSAVIAANVVLLGIANGSREPVGNLRPAAVVHPTTTPPAATVPAPAPPASQSHDAGESQDD
jgi:hypothetical protein